MSVPGSTSGGASFECSLTGTVIPGQFRHLYDRLLGLCEHSAHSRMFEHEMLYTPAIQRPMYAARNDDVHLRLRCKMTVLEQSKKNQYGSQGADGQRKKLKNDDDTANNTNNNTLGGNNDSSTSLNQEGDSNTLQGSTLGVGANDSLSTTQPSVGVANGELSTITTSPKHHGPKTLVTRQYQLCQYGHPEPGRDIVVRSAILVKIHGDAFNFLTLLGYGFEEEFVRRGYNFMFNNVCRISVFRKYKLSSLHDPFSTAIPEEETLGGIASETASPWLIEIASSFVSQENVKSMSDDINGVRNLLAGSVTFK